MLFRFEPVGGIAPGKEAVIAEVTLSASHKVKHPSAPLVEGVVTVSGFLTLGIRGTGAPEANGFDAVTFKLETQEPGQQPVTLFEFDSAPYKLKLNVPIAASYKQGAVPKTFRLKAKRSNDPHPSASQWPANIDDCQLVVSLS